MYAPWWSRVREESWNIGCRTGCPGWHRSLVKPSTFAYTTHPSDFLPPHTHTQTTFKNWMDGLKFCMHPSYPSCTTHIKHKQRNPTHLLAAVTCSRCKHHDHQTDHTQTKMKKRKEDLELWYTHCLAHHLTGSWNTDNLAYTVVSRQSLKINNNPVAVEGENICCHLSITGLNLLHGAKFQKFLSGKSIFLNSKFQIREFHAHWMEWGEVLER